MEFKDNLKKLRTEKGLTQAQLAEAIFVSRSTVAKWENGLGLPGVESMALLEAFFGVTREALATSEPENVIVKKNRRIRWGLIGSIAGWAAMLALLVVMHILPFAIHSGDYGFTWDMVAGGYADEAYIDTGDYRIYYFAFEGNDLVTGQYWFDLQGWRPVQKHFWGFTVSEEDYSYRIITKNNYVVGKLYSIKGKHGYYNILAKAHIFQAPEEAGTGMTWEIPPELISATFLSIGGVEYELQDGFFFITQEPVEYFKIGDSFFDVE